MTTASGLVRYATGDRVRVTGYFHQTPRIVFLGRQGRCSDLVGEKLSECFVADALASARRRFSDVTSGALALRPVMDGHRAGYRLVMESELEVEARPLLDALESALAANPAYAQARRLGQLDALVLERVPPGCLRRARGVRDGEYKPECLLFDAPGEVSS